MDIQPRIAAIVVAAGSGTRLGAGIPKAFVELAGQTLLERSLRSLALLSDPHQIIVVAPSTWMDEARATVLTSVPSLAPHVPVVSGGATRQESVAAGLAALDPCVEIVLVHDAARALTPPALIERVASAVRVTQAGVVPVLPVVDSLKQVAPNGDVQGIADRSQLAAAQTPQGFPRVALEAAYAQAMHTDFTDDAAVFTAAGGRVTTVAGDDLAFKITTAWDLSRAEQVVRASTAGREWGEPRVGTGIDVHAFGEAENLWLAGLHWPGERELSGHSDGDAVAHAMCDALLSAAGLGDIGTRFGTSDPRFENAHGEVFVRETVRLITEAGFAVTNISVQLVGNRPRFSPRRREAEAVLSEWVGAPVSVSATTTDGLGFTGRGDGVAAIATVLLRTTRVG